MNWKIKSFLFFLIDNLNLNNFLYLMQKFVTKRSQKEIKEIYFAWKFHENNLLQKKNPIVLEFGAGKDLKQNIYLSKHCSSQNSC